MWQYLLRVLLSATVVVVVAEVAKRNSLWAAAVASLPLTSLLAFVWLYRDTGSVQRVAELSHGIFWLVLPSLVLFALLPPLLRSGWGFWPSLGVACAATGAAYVAMAWILGSAGQS